MRGFFWPAKRGDDPDSDKRAMKCDGVRECPKTRTEKSLIACKSRTVEDRRTDSIKKKQKRNSLSFYSSYVFVLTCMHFVCSLYASPTAYIFNPSALRTRLFSFLYALYAVNSGVVFPHSMHSRFFDAYNAYKLRAQRFKRLSDSMGGRPIKKRMDGTLERSR